MDNEKEEDEIIHTNNKKNKAKRTKAGMYVRIVDDVVLDHSQSIPEAGFCLSIGRFTLWRCEIAACCLFVFLMLGMEHVEES